VALVSLALSVAGPRWADQSRRQREQELLRVGALYARAIAEFRDDSPGSLKTYPRSLDELTLDKRFVGVRRHLRELYPDPLDPSRPWGLVQDLDGNVVGVFSRSTDSPLIPGPLDLGVLTLVPARHYADWKFVPVQPS
jgi:type II secretory pathway pseudopilin PulG